MFDCLCDWLVEIEWNLKYFESLRRGNEMTFPTLSLCFLILRNSNSFHQKTLEWRWYDFFHIQKKGVWKWFEFPLKIFQIQRLYATQWLSWKRIIGLLKIIWNMSWKSLLWYFETHFHLRVIWIFKFQNLWQYIQKERSNMTLQIFRGIWNILAKENRKRF